MLILAINTASSSTGIALFERIDKSEIRLLTKNSWPAKNDEAEKLMPAIANLLKSANRKNKNNKSIGQNFNYNFSDIKQIYVIKGPGSFTGLRVGVTVANTLAYLNKEDLPRRGCELFGLSAFEYWHSASDLPVLVYAGRGGVYLSEKSQSESEIINLSDLNQKLKSKKIKSITGDISQSQIEILKNIKFIKIKKTFAGIMKPIIEENLQKSIMRQSRKLKSEKIIKPLYIKEPGITQSKKTLSKR